jgi:L-ascorbate metabolism protein UlaG (beta-lactamase superfamily)
VLLSHDQHPDNLDPAGRALLPHVPRVLTTVDGADRLGLPNVHGLENWQDTVVGGTDGRIVRVTGLPATHGPDGVVRPDGTVTGFLLEAEGEPRVYVSGDNASLATVRAIASRVGGVDIAVPFTGAARTGAFDAAGLANLTLPDPGTTVAPRRSR